MLVRALAVVIILVLAYALFGALWNRRSGESPDRTAERAGDRVQAVTGGILSVTRVLVLSVAGVAFTFLDEFATLLGEAPLFAVELGTIGLGFGALSGRIPLTANEFGVLAVAITVIGVVWRNA